MMEYCVTQYVKTYLLALRTPNVTAGLDHVTSTGLPFEVSAENPVAKFVSHNVRTGKCMKENKKRQVSAKVTVSFENTKAIKTDE